MSSNPDPFLRRPEEEKLEVELKFFVKDGSETREKMLSIAKMISDDASTNESRQNKETESDELRTYQSNSEIKELICNVIGNYISEDFNESIIEVEHKFRNSEYYDTKNLDLYKAGCSFRTRRRKQANYRIHVKTSDKTDGKGLFQRHEYRFTVNPAEYDYYQRAVFFPFVDKYFIDFIGKKKDLNSDKFRLFPVVLLLKRSTRIKLKKEGIVEYCIGIDEFRFYDIQKGSIRRGNDEEFLEVEIEANTQEGQDKLRDIGKHLQHNEDIDFSKSSKYGFAIQELGIKDRSIFDAWNYINENKSSLALIGTVTLIINNATHFIEFSADLINNLFK